MKLGRQAALDPGDPAPDVALNRLDGTALRLSSLLGAPVVLSFLRYIG
jgi:peroxiredoxin